MPMRETHVNNAVERFVTLVKRQTILSRAPVLDESKPPIERAFETVTCHNNTDLFVASMNCVRHARINDLSTNYTLLNLENDFMVKSLVLNTLGSLLAVVGETKVVIVALPPFYGRRFDANFTSCSKSFSLGVKKVLWHPASYLNRTLVVLTNDSRLYFVEATSDWSSEAQVNLSGRGIVAESISFGNPNTLTGSLTLYIADKSSSIYAIFPFAKNNSRILATESQVDNAIQEAREIMEWNESHFLYSGIVDSFNSSLQRRLILHYNYLEHLKSQFKSSKTLPADVRVDYNGTALEYLSVELSRSSDPVAVQGPIFRPLEQMSLIDIASFYPNGTATFLAMCVEAPGGTVHMQYFVQASPLLMLWHAYAEPKMTEQPLLSPIVPDNESRKAYKLPRHGFGFVDTDSGPQTCVVRKQQTEKQRNRNSAIRERKFAETNYETLSIIMNEEIRPKHGNAKSSRINVSGLSLDKISILFNDTVYLFDASRMADWCLKSMNSGLDMGGMPSPDVMMPLVSDDIASLFYLNDAVGDTGDYLVYTKASGSSYAEVVHISAQETVISPETEPVESPAAESEDTDQDELARKSGELVKAINLNFGNQGAELLQHLKYFSLRNVTAGEHGTVQGKLLDDPVKSLCAVEDLSSSTVKHILDFTGFAMSLQSKLKSQVVVFKSELDILSTLVDSQVDPQKIEEYQDRIKSLSKRLESIKAKISKLETKLRHNLQKINTEKPLPLSTAEKSWFKELNVISDHLKNDSEKRPSLDRTVQSLHGQAKMIIEELSSAVKEPKPKSASETLKDMELRDHLMRFAGKLHEEERLIGLVKNRLEECFKCLDLRG